MPMMGYLLEKGEKICTRGEEKMEILFFPSSELIGTALSGMGMERSSIPRVQIRSIFIECAVITYG